MRARRAGGHLPQPSTDAIPRRSSSAQSTADSAGASSSPPPADTPASGGAGGATVSVTASSSAGAGAGAGAGAPARAAAAAVKPNPDSMEWIVSGSIVRAVGLRPPTCGWRPQISVACSCVFVCVFCVCVCFESNNMMGWGRVRCRCLTRSGRVSSPSARRPTSRSQPAPACVRPPRAARQQAAAATGKGDGGR